MKSEIMKLAKYSAVLLALILVSCTGGNDNTDFSVWDDDRDGQLNEREFEVGADRADFYDRWDTNKNGKIDESEWNKNIRRQYSDYSLGIHGSYADWDANKDMELDDKEFSKKLFEMWDVNNNGYIEDNEYEEWYYGVSEEDRSR